MGGNLQRFTQIRDWKPALNRFIIEFGDRLDGHL
jgi:transposase-like protein